jgi:predicted phage tail protein
MISQVLNKIISKTNNVMQEAFSPSNVQTVSVIDVISEGPIFGLVDGQASVFLNDDRIVDTNQTAVPAQSGYRITITSGSSTALLNKAINVSNPVSGNRYLVVESVWNISGATLDSGSTIPGTSIFEITTPYAFFEPHMVGDTYNVSTPKARLSAPGQPVVEGALTAIISPTKAILVIEGHFSTRNTSYSLSIDFPIAVSSISGATVTLPGLPNFSGTFSARLTGAQQSAVYADVSDAAKYSNVTTQFRVGNLHQPVLSQHNGIGNTAISNASFALNTLEQSVDFGGTAGNIVLLGTSSAGFAVSATQASQVDEIRFIISYPGGLYSTSTNTARDYPSYAFYKYVLEIRRNGVWQAPIVVQDNRRHSGDADKKSGFAVEEVINLEPFKPFEDYRLTISRRSRHDEESVLSDGADAGSKYKQVATAILSSVTSVIKEPLWYPYTAYAAVTFSSRDFQSVPSRTYHAKGRLVKVPSNYVTRDEAPDGVASYKRNPVSGAIESTDQDWDGSFRSGVYTNNPAWVFLDLITNNRYGLGAWLTEADVDVYSLYRIARYCDELVPDGAGGLEPRFTANLYLTKATDSYKVLKDLATIFRGMLYWMEDSLVPVIDEPLDPVYTFTLGNVIDGSFNYESTGSKTRANQVVVLWTNPASDYKQEALIVEDRDNIIQTGRIISQDAVALGATSEGQALRYGRWKLWTATNQNEVVSFQTSINATFLSPGDVINIQDANRVNISYSGRVSSEGIISTTKIPLDRFVNLNAGSSYELAVVIIEPGTFLTQDSAVINGVTYNKGDLIAGTYTEEEAANLRDSYGNLVLTSWKEYSRVEIKPISTPAGQAKVIDVSQAFSTIPERSAIWAIREITPEGLVSASSIKQYKILSISEEGKNIYSIVAVEHYNEKFDYIDKNFSGTVGQPVYSPPTAVEGVPRPRNVTVLKNGESPIKARTVTIRWEPPESEYVSGYEITHPFVTLPNPINVGKDITSYVFENIFVGTYTIGVKTINSRGNKSIDSKVTFKVGDAPDIEVPRGKGIALGGIVDTLCFTTSSGVFKFDKRGYSLSPIAAPGYVFKNLLPTDESYSQDCSNLPAVNYTALPDDIVRELESYYILFDGSNLLDPFKLIKFNYTDPINIPYWYDAGTGNTSAVDSFSTKSGTVSVSGTTVTGAGTSFLTDYEAGDLIKFSSTKAAIVVFVSSDSSLTIDRSMEVSAGSSHSVQLLRLDPEYDCLVGQVRNDSTAGFVYKNFVTLDPAAIVSTKILNFSSNPPFINFDQFGALATNYSNLVLRVEAFGFENPEFKITGPGFDNADISQVAETVFSPGVDKVYIKTLDKVTNFVNSPLQFTATVREAEDPDNTSKQSIANILVQLIKYTGQKTFYQELEPTSGMVEGDFWVRSSDNRYHRYNGTSWVEIQDTDIDELFFEIAEAQAAADGKIQSFYQVSPPDAILDDLGVGDLWFDTDDGNSVYRWDGTSWVSAKDDMIATAIDNAATAQSTADGKITSFIGTSPPVAEGVGDLWVDTDDGNRLYRWNGSSWVDAVQDSVGRNLDYALKISGETILRGVIRPTTTGAIAVGSINWNSSTGALVGGTGVAITQWGIIGAAAGVAKFTLNATTGNATFAGDITGASGTFSGNLLTSGQVKATGITSSGGFNASIIGESSVSGNRGVLGITNSSGGVGVQGYANSSSALAGVLGSSLGNVPGVLASGSSDFGVALKVDSGAFIKPRVTGHRVQIWEVAPGIFEYQFYQV